MGTGPQANPPGELPHYHAKGERGSREELTPAQKLARHARGLVIAETVALTAWGEDREHAEAAMCGFAELAAEALAEVRAEAVMLAAGGREGRG